MSAPLDMFSYALTIAVSVVSAFALPIAVAVFAEGFNRFD